MEWKNLQALCRRHHGQKERLEVYARETGQLQRLVEWSVDPVSRAKVLRL